MPDNSCCCPGLHDSRTALLNLDHISIQFNDENLQIARCERCGTWLVNDRGYWEPLLPETTPRR